MPDYVLIFMRSLLAFVTLLIYARLMGKKQISQLTLFDYIVGITIGNIAATLSVEQDVKLSHAMIGLLLWGTFPILIGIIGLKSYSLRKLFNGQPAILIKDGKVLENNLRKEKMSTDDLMLSLRKKNAFNLVDVEFAILETDGQLSVMKKSDVQPLTPKAFGMQVAAENDPRLVVLDGHVMQKTLTDLGYSKKWLLNELNKRGINSTEDVFLAQIDSKGNLYVDIYEDAREKLPLSQRLSMITASLSQAQADLEKLALNVDNPQVQHVYTQQVEQLKQSINQLRPYIDQQDVPSSGK